MGRFKHLISSILNWTRYAADFSMMLVIVTFVYAIILSFSFAVVSVVSPGDMTLLSLAFFGFVSHMAAISVKKHWDSELDSTQEVSVNLFLVFLFLTFCYANFVILASVWATSILPQTALTGLATVYLPVLDIYLVSRTGYSPGALVFVSVLFLISVFFNIDDVSVRELLFLEYGGRSQI